MDGITLFFPHADNPWNNACLKLKKKMLEENTKIPYQLLYTVGGGAENVYPVWDWTAKNAKYDIIVWDNSDLLYAPGWDMEIMKHIDDADWLGFRVVECGQIGVASTNIERNFGITAETFDRQAFEGWCGEDKKTRPDIEHGAFAWYSPSAFKKDWFIQTGGFDYKNYPPFPFPVDSKFREKVTKLGCRFAVCNAYAYHLQYAKENMGQVTERIK